MIIHTIMHKHANIYLIGEDNYILFDSGWQDSFPLSGRPCINTELISARLISVFVYSRHSDDSISLIIGNAGFIGDLPPYESAEGYDKIEMLTSWNDIRTCGETQSIPHTVKNIALKDNYEH